MGSRTKAISVFIPAGYREKYGDSVASMHVIRSYIVAGYALVMGRNIRDYLLLGKADDTEYIRGFFNEQDAVISAAYEIYMQHSKPKLYWTSLYMIGVRAVHENVLPFPANDNDSQTTNNALPSPASTTTPGNAVTPPPVAEQATVAEENQPSAARSGLKGLMSGGETRKI